MRTAPSGKKKVTPEGWILVARTIGRGIMEDQGEHGDVNLFIPLPPIADGISKPAALLIRTILMTLPKVKDDLKRRALGGLLLSLADTLDALSMPDKPYWVER